MPPAQGLPCLQGGPWRTEGPGQGHRVRVGGSRAPHQPPASPAVHQEGPCTRGGPRLLPDQLHEGQQGAGGLGDAVVRPGGELQLLHPPWPLLGSLEAGRGGSPRSALILPPDPSGGLGPPTPGTLPSPPPASRGVCLLGVPRQGALLPQEVTTQEADGARGPEPSAAQAETSLLSWPWMTLSLHSAARPFHNHQPPGLAGGQRPRGELTRPQECPPLPWWAHTWCSWNSRAVHSSWRCSASRRTVTGPWVTGLESAGQ